MTGNTWLDWLILAVSLFNTILLLWLGLTVLLNAEQRTWGVWLSGSGLLVGGAFFISHSAILGYGFSFIGPGLNFWWRTGWLPVVLAPLAWYVAMLWYAGFWERANDHLPLTRPSTLQWQRPWLFIGLALAVSLTGLLILANPLPSFVQVAQLKLSATPEIGGIPLLILAYPVYITYCIVLSLAALRHPAPSGRVMGDLARRRARPWLVASSVLLLLVSLLVTWVMVWIVFRARQPDPVNLNELAVPIAWFDLSIATLIAVVVILMGRAIVSYEIFTGKALPRRGFFRHWRSAVILAAGYSVLISWNLTFHFRPIYSLLLATLIMVIFYALFSWRSFAERDNYIELLRPFVASQGLYENLLTPTPHLPLKGAGLEGGPFHALCSKVLGTRLAYLVPLGALAPLVGPGWTFPADSAPFPYSLVPLLSALSPQTMCLPLNPIEYGGALWAIPLWSERGLIGVLLLGEKRDGGLYTQEEIEIARAGAERLIDTQASTELARRLMELQRQRLAQTQLLDQQTRRVLHDDILPSLHTAMLMLSNNNRPTTTNPEQIEQNQQPITNYQSPVSNLQFIEAVSLLTSVHQQISQLLRQMPSATTSEIARLGLVAALRRTVETELKHTFDEVAWQIEPHVEEKVLAIPALTAEVLFYAAREAVRNAAKHGRAEAATLLHLKIAVCWREGLEMVIEDDGVGLVAGTGAGGSGQGLALHSTMLAVVGGALAIESAPGAYTRVILTLPQ
jgi:two-component sensor histidine kinase